MNDNNRYKVGIDCRLAGKKHAGIGRYIENLLFEIPKVDLHTRFDWVFIFHDQQQWEAFLSESDNASFFSSQKVVFAPVRHYSLQEQLRMPKVFSDLKLDLLHVPHFNIPLRYQGKIVVTIHDLLWHEYRGTQVTTLPRWKYWLKHHVYKKVVAKAIHKAQVVFVPTETIKDTVSQYFPDSEQKILVTKEGIGQTFLTAEKSAKVKNNHIIYVGSLYPHKNIDVVLQALKDLPDFVLDLVGSRNVFQDSVRQKIAKLNLTHRVNFLGFVPDEKLVLVFQESFALVQPSLFEGFGLTGVEAMAAGLPVVASNIPIFKEIYKDRAVFFDPFDPAAFVSAMKKLQNNNELYEQLTNFGPEVRQEFSWNAMTQQVLESYLDTCQSQ